MPINYAPHVVHALQSGEVIRELDYPRITPTRESADNLKRWLISDDLESYSGIDFGSSGTMSKCKMLKLSGHDYLLVTYRAERWRVDIVTWPHDLAMFGSIQQGFYQFPILSGLSMCSLTADFLYDHLISYDSGYYLLHYQTFDLMNHFNFQFHDQWLSPGQGLVDRYESLEVVNSTLCGPVICSRASVGMFHQLSEWLLRRNSTEPNFPILHRDGIRFYNVNGAATTTLIRVSNSCLAAFVERRGTQTRWVVWNMYTARVLDISTSAAHALALLLSSSTQNRAQLSAQCNDLLVLLDDVQEAYPDNLEVSEARNLVATLLRNEVWQTDTGNLE